MALVLWSRPCSLCGDVIFPNADWGLRAVQPCFGAKKGRAAFADITNLQRDFNADGPLAAAKVCLDLQAMLSGVHYQCWTAQTIHAVLSPHPPHVLSDASFVAGQGPSTSKRETVVTSRHESANQRAHGDASSVPSYREPCIEEVIDRLYTHTTGVHMHK